MWALHAGIVQLDLACGRACDKEECSGAPPPLRDAPTPPPARACELHSKSSMHPRAVRKQPQKRQNAQTLILRAPSPLCCRRAFFGCLARP